MELGLNAVAGPQGNSFWNDDIRQRKFKRITPTVMRELGLKSSDIKMVKTLEELKESPPNIIIAKAAKHTSFVQNWFKEQSLQNDKSFIGNGFCPNKKPTALNIASGFGGQPAK